MMRTLLIALAFVGAAATPAFAERAVLRGLDKNTGHARDFSVTVGRSARFGSLDVVARACRKNAPEETPEVAIYLEVFDNKPATEGAEAERVEIFHGWIFSSSPGLNAIEHPIYDIWSVDCRA
jgi:hypothetical protein